jgi:hypothetical protein
MLVSIAYTYIETVDPEPAFASGEFNCVDSDGRTYIYQSTWSSGTLTITRGVNNDNGTFSTTTIETFSNWSHSSIEEVNSLSITTDGEMFAVLKRSNGTAYLYKLNYNCIRSWVRLLIFLLSTLVQVITTPLQTMKLILVVQRINT